MSQPQPEPEARAPRWRLKLLIALVVVVVAAIIARFTFAERRAEAKTSGAAAQLAPGQEAEEEEPNTLEKVLPYITEGGSAMLLGYLLALATRAAFKLIIAGLVLGFVALNFLAYKGVLTVDWSAFAAWIGENVLNTSAEADVGQIAQEKIPSAGAGMLGYLLGLKKG
jgi:uncharacterized membrane protein (Fun14 family)